jgi:hypothetical protein
MAAQISEAMRSRSTSSRCMGVPFWSVCCVSAVSSAGVAGGQGR